MGRYTGRVLQLATVVFREPLLDVTNAPSGQTICLVSELCVRE